MDVGTTLRASRERHGLSLDDLASRTKIPARILRALEDNAFDTIPGGLFTRGYIRSYAREVGLDADRLVAAYLAQTEPPQAAALESAPAGRAWPTLASLAAAVGRTRQASRLRRSAAARSPETDARVDRSVWAYVLVLSALLALIVGASNRNLEEGPSGAPPANATPSDPIRATSEADATSGSSTRDPRSDVRQAVATSGESLRLDLEARGLCWVQAVADGTRVIYRLMQPGERESIDARDVTLRIGDPGALTVAINGRPARPLGAAGVPITIRLTPDTAPQLTDGHER